jgi:hypothetical protein
MERAASVPHDESENCESLPETRVDLLKVVSQRTMSPDRKYIFWLNGIVRTGEPTISQTVVEHIDYNKQLSASFFFEFGAGNCLGAEEVFPMMLKQFME